jgi:hypothetical protein
MPSSFTAPLLLATLTILACASANAGEDTPVPMHPESISWFAHLSGGHYLGSDEPEAVRRLSPDALKAYLAEDPQRSARVQAKGQVEQLRKRLGSANMLTAEQAAQLEAIFAADGADYEREIKQRYAASTMSAVGGTWYGLYLRASTQLGKPIGEQFQEQVEEFSRRQITAVIPVLTREQMRVYEQIQRDRMEHHREWTERMKRDLP